MRTKPRLSGRNWQTEAMKPENGCSAAPAVSVEKIEEMELHVGRRQFGPRLAETRRHNRRRCVNKPLRCSM